MTDNPLISDAEIVRLVAEKDNEAAKLVESRLRVLRLRLVVAQPKPDQRQPGDGDVGLGGRNVPH